MRPRRALCRTISLDRVVRTTGPVEPGPGLRALCTQLVDGIGLGLALADLLGELPRALDDARFQTVDTRGEPAGELGVHRRSDHGLQRRVGSVDARQEALGCEGGEELAQALLVESA